MNAGNDPAERTGRVIAERMGKARGGKMKKEKKVTEIAGTGELVAALQAAQLQIISLESRLDEYEWLEESLRKRTRELNERVKELECLYRVGTAMPATQNLAEFLLGICENLPKGFQSPGNTWVSLRVFEQKFSTPGIKTSVHRISRDILVRGERAGELAVSVGPVLDRYHKAAIMPEEERLVEMVAALIGEMVENKVSA